MCVYLCGTLYQVVWRMFFVPELSIMKQCDIKSYVLSFNLLHFYKRV